MLQNERMNRALRRLENDLRRRRLPQYADEVRAIAQKGPFYEDKIANLFELGHALHFDQIDAEIGEALAGKDGDQWIPALRDYSHFSFFRNVIRVAMAVDPADISGEYNDVSDLLMRRLDTFIEHKLGESPGEYAVIRLGSKARTGSDLFSDFDIAVVYQDGLTLEDTLYFEVYAAKLMHLLERVEYKVDFVVRPQNEEKIRVASERPPEQGVWRGNGSLSAQAALGMLSASVGDFGEHLRAPATSVIDKNALTDIAYILGSPAVVRGLEEQVTKILITDGGKERYLEQVRERFDERKAGHDSSAAPDLKQGYGGLMTITELNAYLKAVTGELHSNPPSVWRAAVELGYLGAEERHALEQAYRNLRYVRNHVHLRQGNLRTYLDGTVSNTLIDTENVARDLGVKPKRVRELVDKSMDNVRLIVEAVVSRTA